MGKSTYRCANSYIKKHHRVVWMPQLGLNLIPCWHFLVILCQNQVLLLENERQTIVVWLFVVAECHLTASTVNAMHVRKYMQRIRNYVSHTYVVWNVNDS